MKILKIWLVVHSIILSALQKVKNHELWEGSGRKSEFKFHPSTLFLSTVTLLVKWRQRKNRKAEEDQSCSTANNGLRPFLSSSSVKLYHVPLLTADSACVTAKCQPRLIWSTEFALICSSKTWLNFSCETKLLQLDKRRSVQTNSVPSFSCIYVLNILLEFNRCVHRVLQHLR